MLMQRPASFAESPSDRICMYRASTTRSVLVFCTRSKIAASCSAFVSLLMGRWWNGISPKIETAIGLAWMVGNDRGRDHFQFTGAPAIEDIGEAVIRLRDQKHHPAASGAVAHLPSHVEALGNRPKSGLQRGQFNRQVGGGEHHAHEEMVWSRRRQTAGHRQCSDHYGQGTSTPRRRCRADPGRKALERIGGRAWRTVWIWI